MHADLGSQEVALAGLHADALALLMRVELASGQAQQQAAGQRHQQSLAHSQDARRAQSAIWGKTTAAQQRLDQSKLAKVLELQLFAYIKVTCCLNFCTVAAGRHRLSKTLSLRTNSHACFLGSKGGASEHRLQSNLRVSSPTFLCLRICEKAHPCKYKLLQVQPTTLRC